MKPQEQNMLLLTIFFPLLFKISCIQEPKILSTGNQISKGQTSTYGNWMMVSTSNFVHIYINNRVSFPLQFSVTASSTVLDFHSTEDMTQIIVLTSTGIQVHKLDQQIWQYYQDHSVAPPPAESFTTIKTSDDKSLIYAGFDSGLVRTYALNSSAQYEESQILSEASMPIRALALSQDQLIAGGDQAGFRVYQINLFGFYSVVQTMITGITMIETISASSQKILVSGDNKVELYIHNGNEYITYVNLQIYNTTTVLAVDASFQFDYIIVGGDGNMISFYYFDNGNYVWFKQATLSSTPQFIGMDRYGVYWWAADITGHLYTFYDCTYECPTCIFPNNCTTCIEGFYLDNAWCLEASQEQASNQSEPNEADLTMCFKEEMYENGICHEYCSRECENCVSSTSDCGQCSEFYTKNEDGECVIENDVIRVVALTRPLVNVVRRGGLNLLFFALDDLWLYQFHSRPYDGVLKQVFGMIRLVEERQWEIIGLDEFKDSLESAEVLQVYNRFSNRKYLQKERKSNVFLASTIPYFVFFVPWTLVLVCLCNRLFYALFHCRVSKYLRPYSLWWVLLELLLQNNVEYFTFLGCRALDIPFSFSFQSRCLFLLSALMLLLTCFTAFSSYIIYYSVYQKLASYFLVNMYRLQSSFTLMTISYGLKPMVKGLVHALFYDHFSLQLHLLLLAELAGLLTTLLFEHAYGNHKSKSLLALEVLYSSSFVCLNALILFKMVYFPDFPTITTEVELLTQITVYVMAATLALRILADIILLISCWEWCREQENENIQETPEICFIPRKNTQIQNIFNEQQQPKNTTFVIEIKTGELNEAQSLILNYFLEKERKRKQMKEQDPS